MYYSKNFHVLKCFFDGQKYFIDEIKKLRFENTLIQKNNKV